MATKASGWIGVVMVVAIATPAVAQQGLTDRQYQSLMLGSSLAAGTRITCTHLEGNTLRCAPLTKNMPPAFKPKEQLPTAMQPTGPSVGKLVGTSGMGAMAFKGYQFSNVGTLGELQHHMRSLGISEKIVARDSRKILQLMRSKGGKYELLLTAIVGGGYALYEATKSEPTKK